MFSCGARRMGTRCGQVLVKFPAVEKASKVNNTQFILPLHINVHYVYISFDKLFDRYFMYFILLYLKSTLLISNFANFVSQTSIFYLVSIVWFITKQFSVPRPKTLYIIKFCELRSYCLSGWRLGILTDTVCLLIICCKINMGCRLL